MTCTACGRPVLWALTEKHKRLALDPEPDPGGNQAAYRDGTGRWLTRQLATDREPFGYERRHMPHLVTCTGPQRRGKPKAPAELPANVIPISRARKDRR